MQRALCKQTTYMAESDRSRSTTLGIRWKWDFSKVILNCTWRVCYLAFAIFPRSRLVTLTMSQEWTVFGRAKQRILRHILKAADWSLNHRPKVQTRETTLTIHIQYMSNSLLLLRRKYKTKTFFSISSRQVRSQWLTSMLSFQGVKKGTLGIQLPSQMLQIQWWLVFPCWKYYYYRALEIFYKSKSLKKLLYFGRFLSCFVSRRFKREKFKVGTCSFTILKNKAPKFLFALWVT